MKTGCRRIDEERRHYIKHGLVKTIVHLRDSRNITLREAKDLMDLARKGVKR